MSLLTGVRDDGKTDAVALTNSNAQKVSVVSTVDAPLGTTFAFQVGTATTTSTAFVAGTYARGFKLKNLSSSVTIFVRQGVATTSSWAIPPGESEFFDLADPSVLQVITSSSTAAYQLGGTS